jgi:hypothetical protein
MDMQPNKCFGEHRWFVSEVKGTITDPVVWVVKVCTACDAVRRVIIPLDAQKSIQVIGA